MKTITIYLPEDGVMPYVDGDEARQDGITVVEMFGALKAAMFQAETCVRIKIEQQIIRDYEKEQNKKDVE